MKPTVFFTLYVSFFLYLLHLFLSFAIIHVGAAIFGRRLVLPRRVNLRPSVYIEIRHTSEIMGKEGMLMLTIETFIAVISLCLTVFSIGYSIGSHHAKK